MTKVKHATVSRNRYKKIFKDNKGYQRRGKNCFKVATQKHNRASIYSYQDRKCKRRKTKVLRIQKMGVITRLNGIKYSRFMHVIKNINFKLNKKQIIKMYLQDQNIISNAIKVNREQENSLLTSRHANIYV